MNGNIVTIGGGNGSPVVNESLLRTGKVNFINAISAVFDTGGATGRRRTDSRGQEIAFSDPMRNMVSLVDPKLYKGDQYKALVSMLKSRSWGKVLGQEIFAHFHQDGDGFDEIQKLLSNLTGINFLGKVLPATAESTNIVFSTTSGRVYVGEDQLDNHHMSKDMVANMWLEKKAHGYPDTIYAIKEASTIILSCGSLRGSVLCNILPVGIKQAFHASGAKVYLITNLLSTRNETHNFKPKDFVEIVNHCIGKKRLNGLIVPDITREQFEKKYQEASFIYDLDHSHFLGWEDKDLKEVENEGIQVIKHKATKVVETANYELTVRHDPFVLAKTLEEII